MNEITLLETMFKDSEFRYVTSEALSSDPGMAINLLMLLSDGLIKVHYDRPSEMFTFKRKSSDVPSVDNDINIAFDEGRFDEAERDARKGIKLYVNPLTVEQSIAIMNWQDPFIYFGQVKNDENKHFVRIKKEDNFATPVDEYVLAEHALEILYKREDVMEKIAVRMANPAPDIWYFRQGNMFRKESPIGSILEVFQNDEMVVVALNSGMTLKDMGCPYEE